MVSSEARFIHDSDSEADEDVPLTSYLNNKNGYSIFVLEIYFIISIFFNILLLLTIRKSNTEDTKGWDVFEDPPIKKEVGSLVSTRKFDIMAKITKVLAYICTFCIVLGGGIISKGTMLFMTSQLKKERKLDHCNLNIGMQYYILLHLSIYTFLNKIIKRSFIIRFFASLLVLYQFN